MKNRRHGYRVAPETFPLPSDAHRVTKASVDSTADAQQTLVTWQLLDLQGREQNSLSFQVSHLKGSKWAALVETTRPLAEILFQTAPAVRREFLHLSNLRRVSYLVDELCIKRDVEGLDLFYALRTARAWTHDPDIPTLLAYSSTHWARTPNGDPSKSWVAKLMPAGAETAGLAFVAELADLFTCGDEEATLAGRALVAKPNFIQDAFTEASWGNIIEAKAHYLIKELAHRHSTSKARRKLRSISLRNLRLMASVYWKSVSNETMRASFEQFHELSGPVRQRAKDKIPRDSLNSRYFYSSHVLAQALKLTPLDLKSSTQTKIQDAHPELKTVRPLGISAADYEYEFIRDEISDLRSWSTAEFWALVLLMAKLNASSAARIYAEFVGARASADLFVKYAVALTEQDDATPVSWWLALEGHS